ncbi:MAG: betaine/proline/choline family ABC transporter ATP-binding protein, partial [Thermaerobacterales bacterium]
LVRCINRLIEPTSGDIQIDGESVVNMDAGALRRLRQKTLGMVFQRFGLLPHQTVIENVAYGLRIRRMDRAERLERARHTLAMVGLEQYAESFPDELSGGMQQRVGLARALAIDPEILLMDEPFSALDPLIRRDMQEELIDIQERLNKTILFITHDLDEALKLGDRIAIMKDGRIEQIGRPEEILLAPAGDYVKSFIEDVDRSKILTASDVMQDPAALARVEQGPRLALREMRKHGFSSVFVVNKKRQLEGIATVDDTIKAVRSKESDLRPIIKQDVYTTGPDTPLRDLIPQAVRTEYPIAVLDKEDRLLGIVVRVSVLTGFIDEEADSADEARFVPANRKGSGDTLTAEGRPARPGAEGNTGRAGAEDGNGRRSSAAPAGATGAGGLPRQGTDPTGPSGVRTLEREKKPSGKGNKRNSGRTS